MIAPLLDTWKREGMRIPKGWSAKSKMTPRWDDVKEEIEEELRRCEERVQKKFEIDEDKDDEQGRAQGRKATKKKRKMSELGSGVKWTTVRRAFDEIVAEDGEGLSEESVLEKVKELEGLIIAPIDKYPAEMAVM